MPRLRLALLSGLLLILSACAAISVPTSPQLLTDRDLEQTTANPRQEEESATEDQAISFAKKSIINSENTRVQEQGPPAGPQFPPPGLQPFSPSGRFFFPRQSIVY